MKKVFVIFLAVFLLACNLSLKLYKVNPIPSHENSEDSSSMSVVSPTTAIRDTSSSDTLSSSDASSAVVSLSDTEEPEEIDVPSIKCIVDPNLPLPYQGLIIQRYEDYPLGGSIESSEAIESITISVAKIGSEDSDDNRVYSVSYDPSKDIRACDFSDSQNIVSGKSLDKKVNFAYLKNGDYTFTVRVKNRIEELEVYSGTFTIDWFNYKKLTPANFRNNYAYALKFFESNTEKFMFGYRIPDENSSKIVVEKEWRSKYLTLTRIFTTVGYVHVDALPYIEQAIEYANNTYIRVRGNGRDSGVITVADIVESFDGAFVARLVRNGNYVSHHSFGTALDLNAYTKPNTLNINNREVIRSEVQNNLVYNGLVTENDITYHDFEYNGTHKKYYNGVPYTIQNYLIYELAFYRAGFGWGYYFSHTCDAMHYTLTELDPAVHEAEGTGLRKVFSYE